MDGVTVARDIVRVLDYSPSEMTAAQAQRAAQRDALAQLQGEYGVRPTLRKLTAATKQAQLQRPTPTGKPRARGGRTPESQKVAGFKRTAGRGKRQIEGITTYSLGSEKGRVIADPVSRIATLIEAAQEKHPNATFQVAVYGGASDLDTSPRRRARDHKPGRWKKGDIIPRGNRWGSTAQFADVDTFLDLYGTDEKLTYGPDGKPDRAFGGHSGTDVDAASVRAIRLTVRDL